MKRTVFSRFLTLLSAWALTFGCAVGWDAIVHPWELFLPQAGPVGTMIGIAIGGLAMVIVAWNFHYMMNRRPGPGGVYAYAAEAFGHDHAYLCAWFLCLTYAAIVWSDATAFPLLLRYMLGDGFFRFGFCYTVSGYEVCLSDILISVLASFAIALLCFRRRLSVAVQTVLAVTFAAGFLVCFAAAVFRHGGGAATLSPAFSPSGGNCVVQVLNILSIAPWLFVGFETIAFVSADARFSLQNSFGVMVVTLISAVIAYVVLTIVPVLVAGGDWPDVVASVSAPNAHAFNTLGSSLGRVGSTVVNCTLIGAILTNLIGNTVIASRLLSAMADDGALPAWLGKKHADGVPRHAVLTIVSLTLFVPFFGQTVISVVLDIALVGAAVAYAYTSAATFKIARRDGHRVAMLTGFGGTVLSVVMGLLFLLPNLLSDSMMMSATSYIILVLWCLLGLVLFLLRFRHDSRRRFGRSSVVWISLFVMILLLTSIWVRQTTRETTEGEFSAIADWISENFTPVVMPGYGYTPDAGEWRGVLQGYLSNVNLSVFRNNLVQGGLNLLALGLMFGLYSILRRREREIEREKAKAKSYFFSTVSHDIRTPLNAIIGYSEMLKMGFKTEDEREQAIDSILVSGKTLLGLINDVLDLSKLESGKMEIQPEPTDCPSLMRTVMGAFRASGGKPGLELKCSVHEMPLLMLDPQRLRQIVFNLVGNAVKFTEKGHVELRASFDRQAGARTGVFRFAVEDTGCGISKENLRSIGSAYVQVGSKIARNGGTGLGLAICKQLVAAMGGKMEVDSTQGEGSTFSVVIPGVKLAPRGARVDASEELLDAVHTDLPAAGDSGRMPHRILIVDDSKMNLMVLKALLTNIGEFEIGMAMDGREALKVLEGTADKPYDLVLTDMWMPNMDGGDLVRAIRANPALASLRVVAVTADVESRGTSTDMGFDGILLKPVTAEKLRRTLMEGS